MKKVLALIMAVAMVMTMGVVAFAADAPRFVLATPDDSDPDLKYNTELVRTDGQKIWFDGELRTFENGAGTPGKWFGILLEVDFDITEMIGSDRPIEVDGYDIDDGGEYAASSAGTYGANKNHLLIWLDADKDSFNRKITVKQYAEDESNPGNRTQDPVKTSSVTAKVDTTTARSSVVTESALEAALAGGYVIHPEPLVKGADKLTNQAFPGDSVKSGESVYFRIEKPFNDDDLFEIEVKKGDGSKNVASAKVIEDKLDLFEMSTGNRAASSSQRGMYIEAKMKEIYTDDETKITLDVSLKVLEDNGAYKKGDKVKVEDFGKFWMKNAKDESDDVDHVAGTGGIVIKPVKNEENTILWEDENDELAKLTFTADSDTKVYYPKLSTKWDNILYAELFADQDAFVREFVSNPQISSTSRAKLELYVPYIDEDDELTVDEDSIIVYEQDADGNLIDITDKGTFEWNDDDNFVFTMKTRQLGTYIFAEAPVTEAADDEAPADEVPVDTDKVNPGTGF